MLYKNGVILNLDQPSTEIEKKVKARMAEIAKEYGLHDGKVVSFVYPKEYLIPNKANGGKIDHPASFKIQFRDFVRDSSGSSEWRWAKGRNEIQGSVPSYFPKFEIFTGSWQLGIKDLDLIYYILDVYSRTKGGKNSVPGVRSYLLLQDLVGDARATVDKRVERASLELAIMATEDKGGASESTIRAIALSLFIAGSSTKDLHLLRTELLDIMDKQQGGLKSIQKAYDECTSGAGEHKALVQEAIDMKVIEAQKVGVVTAYYVIDKDGKRGVRLFPLKAGSPHPAQLAQYLSDDKDAADALRQEVESRKE